MSEPDFPLPCIACGLKPEPVWPDRDDRQPYGATMFTADGQYGSTVFDETGGRFLEINVCDRCMREKAKLGRIAVATPVHQPHPEPTFEVWAPYEPEDSE